MLVCLLTFSKELFFPISTVTIIIIQRMSTIAGEPIYLLQGPLSPWVSSVIQCCQYHLEVAIAGRPIDLHQGPLSPWVSSALQGWQYSVESHQQLVGLLTFFNDHYPHGSHQHCKAGNIQLKVTNSW
jgi:hypothetical protein